MADLPQETIRTCAHTLRLFTAIIAAALALTGLTARAVGLDWGAASLSGLGQYPEVNAGTGALVVSGDTAGEVWRIDPTTGAYTVYGGLTSVRDARPDAAGNIWFANWSDKALVRIDAGGTATSWPVGGVVLWGVAFDDAGRVWVADDASSQVFRFNPTSRQLCTYTLPGGGSAEYMVNRNGVLWLGDYASGGSCGWTPPPIPWCRLVGDREYFLSRRTGRGCERSCLVRGLHPELPGPVGPRRQPTDPLHAPGRHEARDGRPGGGPLVVH